MAKFIRYEGTTLNQNRPDCKPGVFELKEGMDPEYEAIKRVWEDGGTDQDLNTEWLAPPTPEQFAQLKRDGLLVMRPIRLDSATREPVGEDEDLEGNVVFWYEVEDGRTEMGFGHSTDGTRAGIFAGIYGETQVHAHEYVPAASRKDELERMSRSELIKLVLTLEASRR